MNKGRRLQFKRTTCVTHGKKQPFHFMVESTCFKLKSQISTKKKCIICGDIIGCHSGYYFSKRKNESYIGYAISKCTMLQGGQPQKKKKALITTYKARFKLLCFARKKTYAPIFCKVAFCISN